MEQSHGVDPALEQRLAHLERQLASQSRRLALYSWLGRLGLVVAVCVLAVAAVLTGVGAQGGDPTRLSSCVDTSTERSRSTNPSTRLAGSALDRACAANERVTAWSQTGPMELTGSRAASIAGGPQGAAGPVAQVGASPSLIGGGPTQFLNANQTWNAGAFLAADTDQIMPTAGTVSSLFGRAELRGTVGTAAFTLVRNGVGTPLACTIVFPATTCSDTANTVSFAAGDLMFVLISNSTDGPIGPAWSAQFVPGP